MKGWCELGDYEMVICGREYEPGDYTDDLWEGSVRIFGKEV